MLDRLIEAATEKLMDWCRRTGRVLYITGTGGPNDIYLIRYYLVRSRWFNVFIHQFLRSDRDDLHDHPWHFATFLVRGAYTEHRWSEKLGREEVTRRHSGGNSLIFYREHKGYVQCMDGRDASWEASDGPRNRLVFRRATDQHKVLTDHSYSFSERRFAPLTICVTGPTIRTWGFVRENLKLITQLDQDEAKTLLGQLPKVFEDAKLNVYRKNGREWVDWREYLGLPPDEPGRG